MCPHCDAPLIALEFEGIEIDYCPECKGVWLDRGELAMICELAGVASGTLTDALYQTAELRPGTGRCPRCRARLGVIPVAGGGASVELDRCPRHHGLWFDHGEIKSVVECFGQQAGAEPEAVARFFAEVFKSETDIPYEKPPQTD